MGCARFLLAVFLLSAGAVSAQGWPTGKPLRWIVPFPPGGSTDIAARPLADRVGQALRASSVVENRTGAGGNIGIDAAAKSAPDGYSILIAPMPSPAIHTCTRFPGNRSAISCR
jgi:tripartite-type tricarboxylate transporter receptor subunit TctC